MDFNERSSIVYHLIEIAEKRLLNDSQKQEICNIINRLESKTDTQVERFILFYNLKIGEKQYRQCDLAKKYNCTSSAIRFSTARIRSKLISTNEKDLCTLKAIVNECVQKYNIKFAN